MLEAQLRAAQSPGALSVGVPPPHHNVLADGTIDDVVYAPDPAYDGRYGYVARTRGDAAAGLLFLGDMLGVTTVYEAMTGRNLSTGQWMTADEQQQSQIMAGVTLAAWTLPVARLGGMAARAETGVVNLGVRSVGTEARLAAPTAAESISSLSQLDASQFASAYGNSVFYAGRGSLNRLAAEASSGTTVGRTAGGQAVDSLVDWSSMSMQEARRFFTPYSKMFAEQASGPVRAWAGGASCDSVWRQTERPTLMRNTKVTKITILDATRPEITRIIYPR